MNIIRKLGPRTAVGLFIFAILPALTVANANAQPLPTWDHYKVYYQDAPIPGAYGVTLVDQFLNFSTTTTSLDWFMNPVDKIDDNGTFLRNNLDLHYTWWRIPPQPYSNNLVQVANQFGVFLLNVGNAEYLLNPALKDLSEPPTGGLPLENHYLCYQCSGPPVDLDVTMVDQFDTYGPVTDPLIPRFLCNPVSKNGSHVPEPERHYVVYEFTPPDGSGPYLPFYKDQFTTGSLNLSPGQFLAVPSLKQIVPVELSRFRID